MTQNQGFMTTAEFNSKSEEEQDRIVLKTMICHAWAIFLGICSIFFVIFTISFLIAGLVERDSNYFLTGTIMSIGGYLVYSYLRKVLRQVENETGF